MRVGRRAGEAGDILKINECDYANVSCTNYGCYITMLRKELSHCVAFKCSRQQHTTNKECSYAL